MILLIDKSYIQSIMQFSPSAYNDQILNDHIRNAQESDIRGLMGDALYYALIKSPSDSRFVDILEEKEFIGVDQYTYYSFGIKTALAYYTMARYMYYGAAVNTPFSTKIKENDFSRDMSFAEKKDQYIERQNLAFEKWKSVERFIYENNTVYPEFICKTQLPRQFSKFNLIR